MTRRETSDRLEVLAFCDYFGGSSGGIEIATRNIYNRLADRFDLTVVSGTRADTFEGLRVVASTPIDLSGLLGAQVSFAPGLVFRAWSQLRRNRPAVVHVSGLHFFGSVVGATMARTMAIPFVLSMHLGDPAAGGGLVGRAATLYERLVGRWMVRHAAAVIAVSESVAQHARRLGARADRTHVVLNGVDPVLFAPGRDVGSHNGTARAPRIAVIGRVIGNKGAIETALALSESEAEFSAVFVGDGPDTDELRRIVAGDPRFELLGHRDGVEQILASTDIFVRYSTTEGRSLAVLEAMSAGCAVVLSDIPANSEIVTDGQDGVLVPLGNVMALRGQIEELVLDPDRVKRLGAAARQRVLTHGWDVCADGVASVLRWAGRREPE